jgi:hypothetical protein
MNLLNEKNTAFVHTLWDRFEFVTLLSTSRRLTDLDYRQRVTYAYSPVQDAFYALLGCAPIPNLGNPTVTLWEMLRQAAWFRQLQALFRQGTAGRRVATRTLADIYALNLVPAQLTPQKPTQAEQKRQAMIQEILAQLAQTPPPEEPQEEPEEEPQEEAQEDSTEPSNQPSNQPSDQQKGSSSDASHSEATSQEDTGQGQGQSTAQADASAGGQPSQNTTAPTAAQTGAALGSAGSLTGTSRTLEYQDVGPIQEYQVILTDFSPGKGPEKVEHAQQELNVLTTLAPYMGAKTQDEALAWADQLASHLDVKAISKFLGFTKRAVRGAHRLTDTTGGELTHYKPVVWAERLHPVDLAGLAQGDPRTQVRMAEGTLRERRFEDRKAKGRGPVIVLRDETGSMSLSYADGRGRSNQQARALEIALAHAFNQEKRDLVSIAWGDSRTRVCTYGVDDVQHHLSTFLNGANTHIFPAFQLGIDKAAEYVEGADILVITDGIIEDTQSHYVRELARRFHATNGRIWAVFVSDRAEQPITADAAPWADGVIHIDQIADEDALAKLITDMNRRVIDTKGKKVMV